MAQDEPQAALYDFLYRDHSRLSSYYAQIFRGRLASLEETNIIHDIVEKCANMGFDIEVANYKKLPKNQRDSRTLELMEISKRMLEKLRLPSAFLLQDENGVQVGGIIKDAGMEEPITSYYLKHGTNGLSDVYIIGIKEQSTTAFTMPIEQMFGVAQQAAQALSTLIFSEIAMKITPLAIFRKL